MAAKAMQSVLFGILPGCSNLFRHRCCTPYPYRRSHPAAGHRTEAARALLNLKELAQRRYVPPLANAFVFLGLGQRDEVFKWLDRAYEERHCRRLPFLNVDSIFDPLRSDPRFEELLRRVGLPP
ncbi:MAG: hypothetical protein ACRD3O_22735 [Terriglobia bacterium]